LSSSSPPVTLLYNGTVLTGCETSEVFTDGAVAWSGDRILAVGLESDLTERFPDINLHHHLYSALARGLAPSSPATDFGQILDKLWWRLDRALTPETVRLSALLGVADSIRWGCTTLFDHHSSPSCIRGSLSNIAEVIAEAGLTALLCYEVSDRNGHPEAVAGLVENLTFIDRQRSHPRVRGTLGLHASFTIEDETLDEAADRRPDGCGCHIHVAEDALDFQVSEVSFGGAPLQRLEERGLLDDRAAGVARRPSAARSRHPSHLRRPCPDHQERFRSHPLSRVQRQ
jgi:cytosine/adenosine deaminase-related metal-dependent hydrolase